MFTTFGTQLNFSKRCNCIRLGVRLRQDLMGTEDTAVQRDQKLRRAAVQGRWEGKLRDD